MLSRLFTAFFLFCVPVFARELDVISYNVRYDTLNDTGEREWETRKARITNFLQQGEIIGIQEGLAHQVEAISNSLPNHSALGVARNDGKKSGEYTAILFNSKKWSLDSKENGTFWLSDTPNQPGSKSWGNQVTRICTWARLVDNHGAGLYVFNTHWDHENQNSRTQAAHQLITKLQQRRYIDEPVIVMGDLNATVDNTAVKLLLKATDWRKRLHLVDSTPQISTLTKWNPKITKGLRIDHIFTSPFLPVKESSVIANGSITPGSDRHPVVTTIHWDSHERKEFLDRYYINETILGKEHGGGNGFIVCWPNKATVRIIGGEARHKETLSSVIDELNQALSGTGMSYQISDTPNEHELRIYFTDSSKIQDLAKQENHILEDNVDGFAGLTWATETKLIKNACVFIATDKLTGDFLRHVILEEVTQTLGLMGDTSVYPESVTYSRYKDQGHAPKLGQCDINALRLIYGHLKAGDTALKTGINYARFWGE